MSIFRSILYKYKKKLYANNSAETNSIKNQLYHVLFYLSKYVFFNRRHNYAPGSLTNFFRLKKAAEQNVFLLLQKHIKGENRNQILVVYFPF